MNIDIGLDIENKTIIRYDVFNIEAEELKNSSKLLEVELFQWEIWGYSLVVPLVCLVGIGANIFSLFVFSFGDLKESIYTYLTVLSVADLLTVILILFSGISRGIGKFSFLWTFIDAFLHIPIASVSTTVSILALVTVTLERLLIIKFPVESRHYCSPSTAKRNCWLIGIFSILFNIPYCFLFTIDEGQIIYSQFGSSRYYKIHNWIRLAVLGFLPVGVLLVSNILLLLSLRRSHCRRISLLKPPSVEISVCHSSQSSMSTCNIDDINRITLLQQKIGEEKVHKKKSMNHHGDKNQHRRVTIILIAMICSFLIGEFPTHLASRSSAISLIFPNNPHLFDEVNFRIFKLISTILMCCHYSCNFFLYCAFNKRFIRELKTVWHSKVKPILHSNCDQNSQTIAWNSDTSNETFNRIMAVTHLTKKLPNKRKRKLSSITQVSLKIGLSKKIYRESRSNDDIELEDKYSEPTSSL